MKEDSLWNITEHKIRRVREYIKSKCDPEVCFIINKVSKPIKCEKCILTYALAGKTANEMLERIEYEVR